MKPKLMIQIGNKHDKHGSLLYDKTGKPIPVFKEVKKVIIMFVDKNNIVSFHKRKPYFTGQLWMVRLKKQHVVIDTQAIYPDSKLLFYIIMKEPKNPEKR